MKYITNNFFAKFMAVILAFLFWVFVMAMDTRLGYLPKEIIVDVINVQTGLAVADDPGGVKIKVKAPMSVYTNLTADNFEAFVDAAPIKKEGVEQLEIKVTSKDPMVQIMGSEPQRVVLKLEEEDTKKMSLSFKYKGEPHSDYKAGTGEVKTKDTEIIGAPSKIKKIDEVAALVALKGSERGNIDTEVPVVAFDENGEVIKFLKFSPQDVPVYLPIVPRIESKSVGIKVNLTGDPAKGYWINKINTDPEVVAIKGEIEKLKNIDFIETEKIDIANTNTGKAIRANLVLPDKISLAENRDVIVQIFVTKMDSAKTITPSINFKKASGKLKVEVISMVSVTLTGPASALDSLSAENVILNVDLNSYSTGAHKIEIKKDMIIKPGGIEVANLSPGLLSIKITEFKEDVNTPTLIPTPTINPS